MSSPDLFMIAGETSGDQLGGSILEALMKKRKDLNVAGIGGPLMRSQGLFPLFPMEELQVMGFMDVIRHIPRILKILRRTTQAIVDLNPKAVVTIDYPGFNLRLAKSLRKQGYRGKLCHVVCPSVWAWGKHRIKTLADHYDLLLTILPFEKELFDKTPLRVEYIGHPLAQKVAYESFPEDHLIAFFPGSRRQEIERNFPFYLRLIPKLQALNPHLQFIFSLSQEKYRPLLQKMMGSLTVPLLSPSEMQHRKPMLAVAKCGTIILELALKGIPTIVTYKISPLDVALAKWVFRIHLPYYSLPNLILNRPLFPELIGPALTDETLFGAISHLLNSPAVLRQTHLNCQKVRTLLQAQEDPSKHAAALILDLLENARP
jgi:lipid-A-disaccharide synthase